MENKIEKGNLEGFQARTVIFSRAGRGYQKRITLIVEPITGRMWYELRDHGTDVYCGPSLDEAIDIYNNIVA